MDQPETRHSLIAHLKGDDNERAWVEFVTLYEPFLQHLVTRLGVPQRHVADVVQQVLLAIAKSVDIWTDDGQTASFRRWTGSPGTNTPKTRSSTRNPRTSGNQTTSRARR